MNPIKNFAFQRIPTGTQEIMKIISKIFNEMKKRIIISIIIVILLVLSIFLVFFKKEKATFTLAEVVRGDIVQEVFETGQLKKGEEASLNFKNSGEIKEIYVKTGDKVESGQVLARTDTSQLEIQLSESEAGLSVIEAGRKDAQISLENARQELEDAMATANEKLEKAYKDAQSVLDDSYLKIYNNFSFISLFKNTYFGRGDAESINIAENKDRIEIQLNQAKFYIDKAKNSQGEEYKSSSSPFADARENKEDIDAALSKTGEALLKIKTALEDIRSMVETGGYQDIVLAADKNTLDTHKLNINTCYSNIVSSQANISLTKTTNATGINTAQSQISVLESQLQEGESGLYQAQINQSRAQKQLLEKQIEDSYLKSPTQGQITEINKKIGEMVQSSSSDGVMTFLPTNPFEIEANIYEEDVVKINIGNPVDISLIPIPERIFKGKVGIIDPAEKIIEGVVYYKIRIFFEEGLPQNLKPGMTADVKIKTASKENVLIVPDAAIQEKGGKKIIQILKNKKIEDREVEIGLEGSDNMVEIISGIGEGEKALIR